VDNHQITSAQIKQLKSKNKRFRQFMEEREYSVWSQHMDLISLMAKPIGRFAYYRLMILRYISSLSRKDPLYEPAKEMLEKWSEVLTRLSAPTEEEDLKRMEMMELQHQLKDGNNVDFLKPGRKLIKKRASESFG